MIKLQLLTIADG